jgi:uncharacterized protein YbjT (DUF2867 family)
MVTGAAALDVHTAAIDAAARAGARRILYTSHQAAAPGSLFAPMPDHAATERYLAGTGVAYTALRNGFYATSLPWMLGEALRTGEIVAPADGPVSWTMHEDLAEAAAMILAGEATFDGPTPPLTAPRALDLQDVAGLLSEISGRPIRRVVADDDEYAARMVEAGVPAVRAQMTLGMYRAARRGEFATTAPDLEKLLGRSATPITAVLS